MDRLRSHRVPEDDDDRLPLRWAFIGVVSGLAAVVAGLVSGLVLLRTVGPTAALVVGLPAGISMFFATAVPLDKLIRRYR